MQGALKYDMMKLQLVLFLVLFTVIKSSPLHAQNGKRTRRHRANEEVRSIISAIVDAILDGDRKRRSEVIDFDDESSNDKSKRTGSLNELKDNEGKEAKIFTKREEEDEDENSLPLADVIATSDVNSTDDETKIMKKDVIERVKSDINKNINENSRSSVTVLHEVTSDNEKPDDNEAKRSPGNKIEKELNPNIKNIGNVNSKSLNSSKQNSSTPENRSNSSHSIKKSKLNVGIRKEKSSHVNSKQNTSKNNIKQYSPDTYTEFLHKTTNSKTLQKHSSVDHMSDDDAEMNEDSEKTLTSKKKKKSQRFQEFMDEKEDNSEHEGNEDKMEDDESDNDSEDKSDNYSENKSENDSDNNDDDKSMNDSKDTTSTDDDDDDDGNYDDDNDEMDSGKNNGKQSKVKHQSKSMKDNSNQTGDLEMESDDRMASGKTKQSKSKTKQNISNHEDNSEMEDSNSGDDQNKTTDSSGSDDDSMRSEKDSSGDYDEDTTDSVQDSGNTQEDSKNDESRSSGGIKDSKEDSKEHSLDSEGTSASQTTSKDKRLKSNAGSDTTTKEGMSQFKADAMETQKEQTKMHNSDSETTNNSENENEPVTSEDQNNSLVSDEDKSKFQDFNGGSTVDASLVSSDPEDNSKNVKEINKESTSLASRAHSVINIGNETNVEGTDSGSTDIDSVTDDSSGSTTEDDFENNLNDLDTTESGEDSSESKLNEELDSSLPENLNANKNKQQKETNSKEEPLEEQNSEENKETDKLSKSFDPGSRMDGSHIENITPNNYDSKEINSFNQNEVSNNELANNEVNSNTINNNEDLEQNQDDITGKENMNLKQINDNRITSGQPSGTRNGKTKTEKEEQNSSNDKSSEVKAEESNIVETSYRFNDDADSSDDDDYTDQANDIWSSSHNDPLLTEDDTSNLAGEKSTGLTQDLQGHSKYGNNLHISGNDIYEDGYKTQNSEPKNWKDGKLQVPLENNNYNWLEMGSSSPPQLQNIQDQMTDYKITNWNGKETPEYLNEEENNDDVETTEQPQLEKRTAIPTYQTHDSRQRNKLPKPKQKNKQNTVTAETLTDNDVYGYTGSIGPFLQKRTVISNMPEKHPKETKQDDVLESLVTDVNEPWIKRFLTKTLEMAVKGDKGILTSDQDGEDDDKDLSRRDGIHESDGVSTINKGNNVEENDDMPVDATNDKDIVDFEDRNTKKEEEKDSKGNEVKQESAVTRDEFDGQTEEPIINQDIPKMASTSKLEGVPLSELIKHPPKSPVADIGTLQSQDNEPLNSVIRITTRVPIDPQLPPSQMIPSTPELPPSMTPEQPDVPVNPPSGMVQTTSPTQPSKTSSAQNPSGMAQAALSILPPQTSTVQNLPFGVVQAAIPPLPSNTPPVQNSLSAGSQTTNSNTQTTPRPAKDLTSQNQAAPARVVGQIIKVITAPGRKTTVKITSKEQQDDANKRNTRFQSEINNAMNSSIQNIAISSSNDVLENTIKEAELIHKLNVAIPVNQRRPVGTEDDLKRGMDDLKDYAVALTEATGLSQAQRDAVAEKLARDLLDEMRIMDKKKQKLLQELMSFITGMEVSTFKERLNEIKSKIIELSSKNPEDIVTIRSTAIKLLDELFKQLPLPENEIQNTEKKVGNSVLLKSLLQAGEKRVLRKKLKKALVDLVADKLL